MANSAYYVDYGFSFYFLVYDFHVPPSPHEGTCPIFPLSDFFLIGREGRVGYDH